LICASLSFDDGFLSQYEYAKILYRLGIPGTFFLVTGLREYNGRKLIIDRSDFVREIIDMGHEIGSHTHTHRDLTKLNTQEIEEEFEKSVNILRDFVDYGLGLAYPYGSFNDEVIKIASKYFIYGRTMGDFNRWNKIPNKYALGGFGIRHLIKLPIRILSSIKLVNIVFHNEPSFLLRLAIEYLNIFGVRFVTLREGLKCLEL
jgi:peptidoglycan/xylan/chitin deacetylase (PgdA/CDA1 family)